jgi:hypothetical protein
MMKMGMMWQANRASEEEEIYDYRKIRMTEKNGRRKKLKIGPENPLCISASG